MLFAQLFIYHGTLDQIKNQKDNYLTSSPLGGHQFGMHPVHMAHHLVCTGAYRVPLILVPILF
jgi:hypothetical protein